MLLMGRRLWICVRRARCVLRVAIKRSCRCDFEITSGASSERLRCDIGHDRVEDRVVDDRVGRDCNERAVCLGGAGSVLLVRWFMAVCLVGAEFSWLRCCVIFAGNVGYAMLCDLRWGR